jgi:hypothetical protein
LGAFGSKQKFPESMSMCCIKPFILKLMQLCFSKENKSKTNRLQISYPFSRRVKYFKQCKEGSVFLTCIGVGNKKITTSLFSKNLETIWPLSTKNAIPNSPSKPF